MIALLLVVSTQTAYPQIAYIAYIARAVAGSPPHPFRDPDPDRDRDPDHDQDRDPNPDPDQDRDPDHDPDHDRDPDHDPINHGCASMSLHLSG
ncbi:MAG: hypothetical protein IT200_17040 [Thermoleophilia bacterium]|nr:hypothetical protein [Thermoleophilia bacterium]